MLSPRLLLLKYLSVIIQDACVGICVANDYLAVPSFHDSVNRDGALLDRTPKKKINLLVNRS